MAVNKINFTINSRQYTVVAEESVEYIEKLCNHINEKVENVISGGQNVLGERPLVLAALNICDEYYKKSEACEALEEAVNTLREKNRRLSDDADKLKDELDITKSGQIFIDEAAMRAEVDDANGKLSNANSQIKFLEGQVKKLEGKIRELEARDRRREQDFLDLIDKQ